MLVLGFGARVYGRIRDQGLGSGLQRNIVFKKIAQECRKEWVQALLRPSGAFAQSWSATMPELQL